MTINRPNTIKVFASDASHGNYLPTKFGTNIPVRKSQYEEVANDNFLFGLESLEGDLQLKDLNSVFFYQGSLLAYLFQQGVPEFSAYQDYPMGAVVQHGGNLWIATKDQKAQKKEPKVDPCDPCGCKTKQDECTVVTEPSKESGWCSFVTHCEYDVKMEELDETNKSLQESIDSIKGVTHFKVIPNPLNQALELSLGLNDGSSLTIPMTNFGKFEEVTNNGVKSFKITNPDGSIINLPAHKASTQLIDSDGTTIGFVHVENEKIGAVTNTIGLVRSSELDQNAGFYWDTASKKWKVDLTDLVKANSGLEVDRNGNIKVKPNEIIDGTTLKVNSQTGKVELNIKENGGLKLTPDGIELATGNGITKDRDGNLILNVGDGVKFENGKVVIDKDKVAELTGSKLAGSGLVNTNGVLSVATVRLMDASGTIHLGNLVDPTK